MTSYDEYEDDYDDYEDDEYDDRRPIIKIVAGVGAVVVLAVGAFLLMRDSPDDRIVPLSSDSASSVGGEPASSRSLDSPTSTDEVSTNVTSAGVGDQASVATPDSMAPSTLRSTTTTADLDEAPSTEAPPTSAAPTTARTTAPPPTTTAPDSTTTSTVPDGVPSYPTLPDGTPQPIVVIYDTDSITVTGVVPSTESRERLESLAVANSQFPDATLISLLTVDPTIPIGVGVRVIELNSARFPPGSTEITLDHAAQLLRVVDVLKLLENVTVTVIGHADQRGDPGENFQLSQARAIAVTNFLAFNGISPERLSARAVGEDDLLSMADDGAALALNRRTEFTFYGLLVE